MKTTNFSVNNGSAFDCVCKGGGSPKYLNVRLSPTHLHIMLAGCRLRVMPQLLYRMLCFLRLLLERVLCRRKGRSQKDNR